MKKMIPLMMMFGMTLSSAACSSDNNEPLDEPQTEQPKGTEDNSDEPKEPVQNKKTLIVYYSFSNNVHTIVEDLQKQIEADVLRVEPAEENVDYAANNYAAGSDLIAAIRANPNNASSYPAIKTTIGDLSGYDTIIVATPLWWSNMAAPMQTFLFTYGAQMAGKDIALIVSSASSGISGVEEDAKRLIPEGKFLTPSLWIRPSQTSNCHTMIAEWLIKIGN